MRDRGERHKFGVKILYNAANLKRVRLLLWHNELTVVSQDSMRCSTQWKDR